MKWLRRRRFMFWFWVHEVAMGGLDRVASFHSTRNVEGRQTRIFRTDTIEVAVTICDTTKPQFLTREELEAMEVQMAKARRDFGWPSR